MSRDQGSDNDGEYQPAGQPVMKTSFVRKINLKDKLLTF